jgi:hypothetical protein
MLNIYAFLVTNMFVGSSLMAEAESMSMMKFDINYEVILSDVPDYICAKSVTEQVKSAA